LKIFSIVCPYPTYGLSNVCVIYGCLAVVWGQSTRQFNDNVSPLMLVLDVAEGVGAHEAALIDMTRDASDAPTGGVLP